MPRARIDLPERIEYRKKNTVVLTFFGDGATSEGDFHEGLNVAGVRRSLTASLAFRSMGMQFSGFSYLAMQQLESHAARLRWRSRGRNK